MRIAAVQAVPVFLDRAATVAKTCDFIGQAGRQDITLLAFSESFIPAYPDCERPVPAAEAGVRNSRCVKLLENAFDLPGSETGRLYRAAKRAGVFVVIGVTEYSCAAI